MSKNHKIKNIKISTKKKNIINLPTLVSIYDKVANFEIYIPKRCDIIMVTQTSLKNRTTQLIVLFLQYLRFIYNFDEEYSL